MNTAWYFAVPPRDPIFTEHVHNYDELIGFFGSNPDDPYDPGGVVEFSVNGEAHRLTKTTMICCPPAPPTIRCAYSRSTGPIFPFLHRHKPGV